MPSILTLSFLGVAATFDRGVFALAKIDAPEAAPALLAPGPALPQGDRPLPNAAAPAQPASAYVLKRRSLRRRASGYSRRAEGRM